MTLKQSFYAGLEDYGEWRERLAERVVRLRQWLELEELGDPQSEQRIAQVLDKLGEDRLVIAFVAEFSRGKTELINAIFFASFGQRLLPSAAGRTTMCPTELAYDSALPACIRLLPIETRAKDATVADYKHYPEEWTTLPLDLSSADRMESALSSVSQTLRVPVATAREYGLYDDEDALNAVIVHTDETVDIARWRHAVVNFPHPLLKRGVVILDTPGLNAIGTEPELTLSLLPNAHAVLFILAADAGVTKTDLEVWRRYIAGERPGANSGRLVILNKIDGLWDELKSNVEVAAGIKRQVQSTAKLLALSAAQIFPVSAQKGFIAKVNRDQALLDRSRLPALESALSAELIPGKRRIVGETVCQEIGVLVHGARAILQARLGGLTEQLGEFRALRGKNQDVVAVMLNKARASRGDFEKNLQKFVALRSVFTQHSNKLFVYLGTEAVRTEIAKTRQAIEAGRLTRDVRSAMADFFRGVHANLDRSAEEVAEIIDMMTVMYAKFNKEHGLAVYAPPPLSTLKYRKDLEGLENAFNLHFNTLWNMLSKEKATLQRKFFETVARRVIQIFDVANRDAESWIKATISPMEGQIREHELHQRRRMESVKRIHKATAELEDRIEELEQAESVTQTQLSELTSIFADIEDASRPHPYTAPAAQSRLTS